MNPILESAYEYAEFGWRVVPCNVKKKHPELDGWQKLATTDERQIDRWFSNARNGTGLSLVFGPSSGIVDIDVDDAECGDALCKECFGGEWPHTPTYLSGNKKTPHRLFKYSPELPAKAHVNLRKTDCQWDIDVKIGYNDRGSHSVAPPSAGYQWVDGHSPQDCEPAALPDVFIAWINNMVGESLTASPATAKSAEHWDRILEGVNEGDRHDSLISYTGKIVQETADLDSADNLRHLILTIRGVNQLFQPSLPDDELTRMVRDIVERERGKRTIEGRTPATPDEAEAFKAATDGLRLVIIDSDPPMFELYAEAFRPAKIKAGCLVLDAETILSPAQLAVAAMKQANIVLTTAFKKRWLNQQVLQRLCLAAERQASDPAEDAQAILAQAILATIEETNPAEGVPNDSPDSRGAPLIHLDNSVTFGLRWLMQGLAFEADRPKRTDVVRLLKRAKCKPDRKRSGPRRIRFWRARSLESIRSCAFPGE